MAVGKNITWKREIGKQYNLPYIMKAVGNTIKLGTGGDGDENVGEENQVLRNGDGDEYQVVCNFLYLENN